MMMSFVALGFCRRNLLVLLLEQFFPLPLFTSLALPRFALVALALLLFLVVLFGNAA